MDQKFHTSNFKTTKWSKTGDEAEQQNACCTENEAEHGRLCLESVTVNLTGNAQPGHA